MRSRTDGPPRDGLLRPAVPAGPPRLPGAPRAGGGQRARLARPGGGRVDRGINPTRVASPPALRGGGGGPLLSALNSGARAMTNMVMQEGVEGAIERVREGESLARALGAARIFPPLMVHLVASGEVSGKLEDMLGRAARLETQSLERRLAVLLTLLEPIMILVMGGVVLMIVLAILLPISEINQLVR